MTELFEYDVFLSYSKKDKKPVHVLAKRLKDDGLKVWLDAWVLKPGDPIGLKIQQGLEKSRTLLMCMSPAYFDSEWATLEHHTLLFRDPTNAKRRFIPILIKDCIPPDVIAQFLHIDWRKASDEAYGSLLTACHEDVSKQTTEAKKEVGNEPMVLSGHQDEVWDVVITPDGSRVISASADETLKVWNIETGKCLTTFKCRREYAYRLAITPDGKNVISGSHNGTLEKWNIETGKCLITKRYDGNISGLVITPDGRKVIYTSDIGDLKVLDLKTFDIVSNFKFSISASISPSRLAITRDGKKIVTGIYDDCVKTLNVKSGKIISSLSGHSSFIMGVAITHDSKMIVSSSCDNTIKVWSLETGKCHATFEGHREDVNDVAVSPNSKIVVSASDDNFLKVWHIDNGQCLATFGGHTDSIFCIAVTPDGRKVISGSADGTIRVWDMTKVGTAVKTVDATRYTNAKVVLVGESGVGKSGLAIRLVEDRFEPTISTDAHVATQFSLPHKASDKDIDREIWLWDFAGQADYRLIHQLFMDETEVAALVFNPQNENPFEGLGQWTSDLEKASRRPFKKLLVAGRCDRGGLMVTKKSVHDFQTERGFAGYIETSARTGEGCDELRKAIIKNIDWKSIPWTATSKTFKTMKDEIIKLREEGKVLLRMMELKQQLEMRLPKLNFTPEELRAVVGLLAGPGMVWKLEFGDFVLLRPEKINAYAAAVVRKVRKHTEEIGCIMEREVLEGELDYQDMERLSEDDEPIILRAMHQTFVDHGICIREETERGTQLVFPSYFKRERPPLEGHPAPFVSYRFSGGLDEIYSTLIARLYHAPSFNKDKFWRFAADFKTESGKRVGVKMVKEREGSAELIVYCDPKTDDDTKVTFIRYVHEHLLIKGVDLVRNRHYVCHHCHTPVENHKTVLKRLEAGKKDIICVDCEKRVDLWDIIEEKFASDEFREKVRIMGEMAKEGKDNESKELILTGHAFSIAGEAGQIFRPTANSDHGIDGEIEFKNNKGEASGKRLYLQLKSGDSYLYEKKDGKKIFTIKKPRHAKYWQAQAYPVMLVIRTSNGEIRWMNVSDYLKGQDKAVKQIVFDGEPFTALNVVKLRNRVLAEDN